MKIKTVKLQSDRYTIGYERLGGYNSIAAVNDDLVGRLVVDKQLGRFHCGTAIVKMEICDD